MNGSFLLRRRPRAWRPGSSRHQPGCSAVPLFVSATAPGSDNYPEKGKTSSTGLELRADRGREEHIGVGRARGA